MNKKHSPQIVCFGVSHGLGAAYLELLANESFQMLSFSRTDPASREKFQSILRHEKFDAAKVDQWGGVFDLVEKANPEKIFLFLGGGPFGPFETKQFKDHEWAWNVSFRFQAFLLHAILQKRKEDSSAFTELKQIIFIGSSVAESKADPGAASYAAAKHALIGLITSVQAESRGGESQGDQFKQQLDIRLVSPPYMNTRMLPASAWPREQGLVREPREVALEMKSWLENPLAKNGHLVIS